VQEGVAIGVIEMGDYVVLGYVLEYMTVDVVDGEARLESAVI
jgi:hypothetical protein